MCAETVRCGGTLSQKNTSFPSVKIGAHLRLFFCEHITKSAKDLNSFSGNLRCILRHLYYRTYIDESLNDIPIICLDMLHFLDCLTYFSFCIPFLSVPSQIYPGTGVRNDCVSKTVNSPATTNFSRFGKSRGYPSTHFNGTFTFFKPRSKSL